MSYTPGCVSLLIFAGGFSILIFISIAELFTLTFIKCNYGITATVLDRDNDVSTAYGNDVMNAYNDVIVIDDKITDFIHLARDLIQVPANKFHGSQQVGLLAAAYVTSGPILEMGGGYFSTSLLHNISTTRGRFLITADAPYKWLQKLKHVKTHRHRFKRIHNDVQNTWADWDRIGDVRDHWGLVFIDQTPSTRRRVDLHKLKHKSDLLVVHDTEYWGYCYNLSKIRYKFEELLHPKGAGTTIVSDIHEDLVQRAESLVKAARGAGVI